MGNKKFTTIIYLLVLGLFISTGRFSYSKTTFSVGEISILNPRIVIQQNDSKDISVIFVLINRGDKEESLVRTRILAFDTLLFDEVLNIGPGEEIKFKRFAKYGKIKLSEYDLHRGDRVPIDLFFKNNGSILIFAKVVSREN
jgi:copper(I)-binding protein|tara:strand:- start:1093 stop:1518 length:426 start_codon:yes stop_codon:yes gene_type:complete